MNKKAISPLFLVGFMGSGKSYLGKKLAQHLSRKFVDTDRCLERQEGLSIEEIFKQKGEAYFRDLESKFLRDLPTDKAWIIATGGGMPIQGSNMKSINQKGKSIFLCASPSLLMRRLRADSSPRPLLDKLSLEEQLKFVEEKLLQRTPIYNKAQHTFFLVDNEEANVKHFLNLDFS